MGNSEILKFAPDHLKTKRMCKHAVSKLPFVKRYVPDQNKTQQMSDKAILEDSGALESVPDCYKNQQMCQKAADNYPHTLKFIPDCCNYKKCVIYLSIHIILQYSFFLIAIGLKNV